ncbi:hypothetical protein JOL62DRAFT_638298 [Phyllosticta paracitricarpa]|uniref:Uncharacterized protein n=1 Tax=Phyllosticta paracitricarpa TaxID=2016321 RepID=A0ABR1N9S1_9PEZI
MSGSYDLQFFAPEFPNSTFPLDFPSNSNPNQQFPVDVRPGTKSNEYPTNPGKSASLHHSFPQASLPYLEAGTTANSTSFPDQLDRVCDFNHQMSTLAQLQNDTQVEPPLDDQVYDFNHQMSTTAQLQNDTQVKPPFSGQVCDFDHQMSMLQNDTQPSAPLDGQVCELNHQMSTPALSAMTQPQKETEASPPAQDQVLDCNHQTSTPVLYNMDRLQENTQATPPSEDQVRDFNHGVSKPVPSETAQLQETQASPSAEDQVRDLNHESSMPASSPTAQLQMKTPGSPSFWDRVGIFDNQTSTPNLNKMAAQGLLPGRSSSPLVDSAAEIQYTNQGVLRPATPMTRNNTQKPSGAGTKRSRSPDDQHSSRSDSVGGVHQFGQLRRAVNAQEAERRHTRRDSYQPIRVKSCASDDEDSDTLFVPPQPNNAIKIESSPSNYTDSDSDAYINMNRPKRDLSARELKQRLAGKQTKDFSRKLNPERDPENIAIKRMRCNDRMQFDEIAEVLNKQRVRKGLEPTFTNNAVYGRFQRISPRIAALEGQRNFNYRDYLHIPRQPRLTPAPNVSLPTMSRHQERLFVEAYEQVKRDVWVYTAAKFEEMGGFHLSPEQAALKFKSI